MYKKKTDKATITEKIVMVPDYMNTLRLLEEGVTLKLETDKGRLTSIRLCISRCRREGYSFSVKYNNPENYMLVTKTANPEVQ